MRCSMLFYAVFNCMPTSFSASSVAVSMPTSMFMFISMWMSMSMSFRVDVSVSVYVWTYVYVCFCICVCVCMCIRIRICICNSICICRCVSSKYACSCQRVRQRLGGSLSGKGCRTSTPRALLCCVTRDIGILGNSLDCGAALRQPDLLKRHRRSMLPHCRRSRQIL